MNRDEEYDLLAEEQERMRQFELYRKLCFSVLLKRWRMIVLIFLVTLTGLAAFCQFRFMNSRVRYEARTGLFFYPKQTKRYTERWMRNRHWSCSPASPCAARWRTG